MVFCWETINNLFILFVTSAYEVEGITMNIKQEVINEKRYLLILKFILRGFG